MGENDESIDKAIILAAGRGHRMGGLVANRSKPLLPLDDSGALTFLDWHLRALSLVGVREVYIVGNHDTFGARLTSTKSAKLTWIMNDHPGEKSGSGHSMHLAISSEHAILDGGARVLLMDADIVYDPLLLREFASAPGAKSKTLVCARFRETNEEVLVFASDDGAPRIHGKGLWASPLVKDMRCLGEATGLVLIEPQDHDTWLAASNWCIQFSTAKTRSEHEDITQRMMMISAMDAVVFNDDRRFMECDNPDEYAIARSEMVPRWKGTLP